MYTSGTCHCAPADDERWRAARCMSQKRSTKDTLFAEKAYVYFSIVDSTWFVQGKKLVIETFSGLGTN